MPTTTDLVTRVRVSRIPNLTCHWITGVMSIFCVVLSHTKYRAIKIIVVLTAYCLVFYSYSTIENDTSLFFNVQLLSLRVVNKTFILELKYNDGGHQAQ